MKKECFDCFWYRGSDYEVGQSFCTPRMDDNKKPDSGEYMVRYCSGINDNGQCQFWTSANEYGFPGRVYRFLAIYSFQSTIAIVALALIVFFITKLLG